MLNIAIIPSNGRPTLVDCVDAIMPQVDYVFIVRTAKGDCCDWTPFLAELITIIDLDSTCSTCATKNISHWWNLGLQATERLAVQEMEDSTWNAIILNDDAIVPEGWVNAVATPMRNMRAAAGCSGGTGPMPILHAHAGPVDLGTRMQGFAFMLAGERGLRADERFVWWCGDDDLDWRARQAGGVVMVPGFQVDHRYPNGQFTPELHAQTAADMQSFVDKWGQRPW